MGKKYKDRNFYRKKKYYSKHKEVSKEENCPPINLHEQAAEAILCELKEKDGVFHFVIRKHTLDQAGIDWVIGKHVQIEGHSRDFRLHIQHKSSEQQASRFKNLNPCIPIWVHNYSTPFLDGKINLLKLIVKQLARVSSTQLEFFEKKLCQFESLK